jgi:hypothetical protein
MADKATADKKNDAKSEGTSGGAEGAPKKSGGLKFALITVALLAVEAGVLFTVFSLGGPKDAQATHAEEPAAPDPGEDSCEVPVFTGPLFNDRSGINYGFKVEVFVATKAKHREAIAKKIEDSKAALRAEIAGIWRMASSDDLSDPLYKSLERRIEAALMERLNPAEGSGKDAHSKDSHGKDSHGKDAGSKDSGGKDAGGRDAEPPHITKAVVISSPAVRQER